MAAYTLTGQGSAPSFLLINCLPCLALSLLRLFVRPLSHDTYDVTDCSHRRSAHEQFSQISRGTAVKVTVAISLKHAGAVLLPPHDAFCPVYCPIE